MLHKVSTQRSTYLASWLTVSVCQSACFRVPVVRYLVVNPPNISGPGIGQLSFRGETNITMDICLSVMSITDKPGIVGIQLLRR